MPAHKYDLLMVDPPWPKKKGGLRKVTPHQTRELDYATLPVAEIFELLDREVLPAATVFLWTIDQFLHDAEQAMLARGYKLHARMVWDKGNGVAPAFTIRYTHEYLLWFYQSPMAKVATDQRGKFPTVFRGQQRQHSRKPDEAYALVSALYPNARRLDVFSREKRAGWDQWGNQIDHFADAEGAA